MIKANKLSVNFFKKQFFMFHKKKVKLYNSVTFKFDGKGLTPTRTVKYLGVILDQHLLRTK